LSLWLSAILVGVVVAGVVWAIARGAALGEHEEAIGRTMVVSAGFALRRATYVLVGVALTLVGGALLLLSIGALVLAVFAAAFPRVVTPDPDISIGAALESSAFVVPAAIGMIYAGARLVRGRRNG